MNILKFCSFLLVCIFLSACDKEPLLLDEVPEEKALVYADSLSFEIDGKPYFVYNKSGSGIGNRQINIKPYTTTISGQKLQYETGNYFWYGEKDSTLFNVHYSFQSRTANEVVEISFSKKFHNNQLRTSLSNFKIPDDNLVLFKEGKQTFAVDLDKENTTDGVALGVSLPGRTSWLTSYMPGFSILVRPNLNKEIQDNSSFEIIKVQKIADNRIFVQAKFELNLFDGEGKLYRLKNGFIQFKAAIKLESAFDAP